MKAIVGTALAVVLATFVLMRAVGADAPNRPPGVAANEWAPISDTLGIVLVDTQMAAGDAPIVMQSPTSGTAGRNIGVPRNAVGGDMVGAALISPVTGYPMVKRGKLWQRLIVIDPIKGPGVAG